VWGRPAVAVHQKGREQSSHRRVRAPAGATQTPGAAGRRISSASILQATPTRWATGTKSVLVGTRNPGGASIASAVLTCRRAAAGRRNGRPRSVAGASGHVETAARACVSSISHASCTPGIRTDAAPPAPKDGSAAPAVVKRVTMKLRVVPLSLPRSGNDQPAIGLHSRADDRAARTYRGPDRPAGAVRPIDLALGVSRTAAAPPRPVRLHVPATRMRPSIRTLRSTWPTPKQRPWKSMSKLVWPKRRRRRSRPCRRAGS
jgi:hypothetical protein